jgi:hypothetical protein
MKHLLPLVAFITFPLFLFCQKGNLIKRNFITSADMTLNYFDFLNKKPLQEKVIFPPGWKFMVVDIIDDQIIVKQWFTKSASSAKAQGDIHNSQKLTTNDLVSPSNAAFASSKNDYQFFSLGLKEFEAKADPYYPRGVDFTFGVMTIPIKLRAGVEEAKSYFDYEEKFNIGLSGGLKFDFNSRKKRSINFLINVSISNVKLDSLSTNGFQKTPSNNGAFTMAVGTVFQQENLNLGFFLGWDKVPGILGRNWAYDSRPWIGVGIGFSLFSVDLGSSETGKNK